MAEEPEIENEEIQEPDDGSITTDVDEPDYEPPEDIEAEEPDKEQPSKEDEPKEDDEHKEALDALRKKLTDEFNDKLTAKDKEINRLGYALRTAGKKQPEKTDDEGGFSDAQLLAIMQEHKDDPTVLLQVMKEVAGAKGKEAEASAERAAEIKQKSLGFDSYIKENFPEAVQEGSELHSAIDDRVEYLHLTEHPFGRVLALATIQAQQIPDLVKKVKKDTEAELLSKNADLKRKQRIKTTQTGPTDKSDGAKVSALSKTQLETAKKLFGKDEKAIARYAKMLGKKTGTFTAAVQ